MNISEVEPADAPDRAAPDTSRDPQPSGDSASSLPVIVGIAAGVLLFAALAVLEVAWRQPGFAARLSHLGRPVTLALVTIVAGACAILGMRWPRGGLWTGITLAGLSIVSHALGGDAVELTDPANGAAVLIGGGAGAFPMIVGVMLIGGYLARTLFRGR